MASLSLSAVSQAVYGALNVSAVTNLVGTRIYDDVPRAPTYPFVWFDMQERDLRGLGTGYLPEVDVRLHVFSTYAGAKEAQDILNAVIGVLKDVTLTVTGFTFCGKSFYDETVALGTQEINGAKVRELVAMFRVYVEA